MSEHIVEVTDSSFQSDVLESSDTVIVDFWAEWCGPCKMLAPIFEDVSMDYQGKLKFCKMDVQTHQETAKKYAIRGIPALLIFKGGEVAATKMGALSRSQLIEFIDENL